MWVSVIELTVKVLVFLLTFFLLKEVFNELDKWLKEEVFGKGYHQTKTKRKDKGDN